MKSLEEIQFDYERCRIETGELRDLLAKNESLKEKEHILPFFKTRKHHFA